MKWLPSKSAYWSIKSALNTKININVLEISYLQQYQYCMESESTKSKINPIDFNSLLDEMTSVMSSLAIERSSSNAGTELFS